MSANKINITTSDVGELNSNYSEDIALLKLIMRYSNDVFRFIQNSNKDDDCRFICKRYSYNVSKNKILEAIDCIKIINKLNIK